MKTPVPLLALLFTVSASAISLRYASAANTLTSSLLKTRTSTSPHNLKIDPSCPANGYLPAAPNYLSPSLIVPVSQKLPNVAFGSTKFPLITPNDFCSIFNLHIPPTAVDKTCTLEFLFPDHDQTKAPFVYSGGGHFTFTGYAYGSGATESTTFNMQPAPRPSPPTPPSILAPGNAYIINIGSCGIPPGLTESVTVSGLLCSNDTTLAFLQSDQKCPLGFFVALS